MLLAALTLPSVGSQLATGPAPYPDRLRWWSEARFGMFIHWGPVALKGTEISWSRANSNTNCPNQGEIPVEVYDNLFRKFNPTNFHAREWVQLARRTGMKYMVLTAKHCDGFCLWPTKAYDYHIGNSPFRRDVVGELTTAAHGAGMRLGWYYSPMDWREFRLFHRSPVAADVLRGAPFLPSLAPFFPHRQPSPKNTALPSPLLGFCPLEIFPSAEKGSPERGTETGLRIFAPLPIIPPGMQEGPIYCLCEGKRR